jgi:hypothetical protein
MHDQEPSPEGQKRLENLIRDLYTEVLPYNMAVARWSARASRFKGFDPAIVELEDWDSNMARILQFEQRLATASNSSFPAPRQGLLESLPEENRPTYMTEIPQLSEEHLELLRDLCAVDQGSMLQAMRTKDTQAVDDLCQWACFRSVSKFHQSRHGHQTISYGLAAVKALARQFC